MYADKEKTRTRTKGTFDLMTVEQVMREQVQAVHLKTKGDVVASFMIEGFVVGRAGVDSKHHFWASSASMICWPP